MAAVDELLCGEEGGLFSLSSDGVVHGGRGVIGGGVAVASWECGCGDAAGACCCVAFEWSGLKLGLLRCLSSWERRLTNHEGRGQLQ